MPDINPLSYEAQVQEAISKALASLPKSDLMDTGDAVNLLLDLSSDVKKMALVLA